jgi:hypothetical protein
MTEHSAPAEWLQKHVNKQRRSSLGDLSRLDLH